MSQAITVAERYIAAWNEKDPAARRDALSAQWARSAVYRDPIAHAEGLDAIDSMIAGVQTRFPAFRFALKHPATGYGDIVRLAWSLGPKLGEAPIEGSDVVVLAEGKIKEVIGFLDKVPQQSA